MAHLRAQTSNMKFLLNGGLLLGTVDGANVELGEAAGEENCFFFGVLEPDVRELRLRHQAGQAQYAPQLLEVVDALRSGQFSAGEGDLFEPLLSTIFNGDHYLISDDFLSYLEAQKMIDAAFVDKSSWVEKCINTTSKMGRFSSDRAVQQYAEEIWNIEPVAV